jgi:AraC family transcriptional activator of pyochelin receptor
MEERTQRVLENGTINMIRWYCDDIVVGHAYSDVKPNSSFEGSSQQDVVRLHFGLKGDYSFYYKQFDKTYDLIGSHHNIMYTREFDIVVKNKTARVETFGVQFPAHRFIDYTTHASDHVKRFAEAVVKGENVILSEKWGAIDAGIQQVIQQIIHCKFTGEVQKIFLLSKSMELLVLSAEAYNTAMNKTDLFITSKADKEKLIAVRDLIIERANRPPNLSEIAKTVGLNEYKLKRGFKEIFNTTVFGYLTEQRLQMARQYLLDTRKTAAEISTELGYATPQHFNNAFKKKFGVTPYAVRK